MRELLPPGALLPAAVSSGRGGLTTGRGGAPIGRGSAAIAPSGTTPTPGLAGDAKPNPVI
eukprot:4312985-Prorocentrum_lima.AAC.1